MDKRDSHCPYLPSSETTAKGTGLDATAGKEDPVEFDSSLYWLFRLWGVAYVGVIGDTQVAPFTSMKYHNPRHETAHVIMYVWCSSIS